MKYRIRNYDSYLINAIRSSIIFHGKIKEERDDSDKITCLVNEIRNTFRTGRMRSDSYVSRKGWIGLFVAEDYARILAKQR